MFCYLHHFVLKIISPKCFPLTSYTFLKPHLEGPQYSTSHFFWYCNIIMNKIFQFVSYLKPTFRNLNMSLKYFQLTPIWFSCWEFCLVKLFINTWCSPFHTMMSTKIVWLLLLQNTPHTCLSAILNLRLFCQTLYNIVDFFLELSSSRHADSINSFDSLSPSIPTVHPVSTWIWSIDVLTGWPTQMCPCIGVQWRIHPCFTNSAHYFLFILLG